MATHSTPRACGLIIIMGLLASIASELKANAGVSALVAARVYTDVPTGILASKPYLFVSFVPGSFHAENQDGADQLHEDTVQVNGYDDAQDNIENLMNKVRAVFHGIRAKVIGTSPNQETVVSASLISKFHELVDTLGPRGDGSSNEWMGVTEWKFWHREALS